MGLYNNRIVVKVGTSTLTNDAGKSDLRTTDRLVCVLSDIQNMGYEVVLVSSASGRRCIRPYKHIMLCCCRQWNGR